MACVRRATAIAAVAEQLGKRIGNILGGVGVQLCRKCLGRLLAFDGAGHFLGFGLFVVQAHEYGGVTDIVGCLFVLFDQNFQIAQIPTDFFIIRLGVEVADHGRAGLTIAVHAAIALLKNHERPGNVEVNQPVCLVVQVETLGGHIRRNEQPQRGVGTAKIFHCLLDLLIRQLAVQDSHGLSFQAQHGGQVLVQKMQGFDALGKEDQAVGGVGAGPAPLGQWRYCGGGCTGRVGLALQRHRQGAGSARRCSRGHR